ncbi:hypothetical protein KDX27_42125 [Burkholderia cenocepacia]|uniref:hypothetical protein n=1 Tax=Burkholderia cenocepacia TaxID=95486 RepID=UPI001B939EA6|nr:hypothetical protein [Burkholderia cenocepacia]MBR8025198.1 hypothetical protein [Burkholderia cenocepacia]MBR8174263.1 hypothetical protein [Burkholderia cenocepacia]
MNEIKHTPGLWEVDRTGYRARDNGLCIMAGDLCVAVVLCDNDKPQEHNARVMAASTDMAEILEMLAAEADAGTVMIPSALRLTIDAALIKAGRKAAPEPVRHVTIAGVDR